MRKLTTLLSLAAASGAMAFNATLTLHNPDVVIDRLNAGQNTAWINGRIEIHEDFNSVVLWIPYAYREGIGLYRNDYELSQGFLDFVGSWPVHLNGGVYDGPLFQVQMDPNDIGGLYNHVYASSHPCNVYLYQDGNVMDRTNEVPYTITLITPGRLTLNVDLQDYSAPIENQGVEIVIRTASGDSYHYELLDANGQIVMETGLSGPAEILVKGDHWLRQSSGPITLGQPLTVDLSLYNGDVDYDNEIGIGDYAVLSGAFNTTAEDENYVYSADLNGDMEVGIGDYAILSQNYGLLGDD